MSRLPGWTITEMLGARWPELVQADRDRNAGMPIDLISVEGYAKMDGITPEEYIIKVLRAERERRQIQERAGSDRQMADQVIDEAILTGQPVVEYVLTRLALPPGRIQDVRPEFLAKLIARLEERNDG